MPGDSLETHGLTLPELGNGPLHGLLDLIPAPDRRADRIGEADVIPPRNQLLHGGGISLDDLIERPMILLHDQIYGP